MSNMQNVQVILRDDNGKVIKEWNTSDFSGEAPNPSKIMEENFKEAMNGYRYFGQLRATVSWSPANIALGIVSFVGQKLDNNIYAYTILTCLLVVTLSLIFFVQFTFQQYQNRCRLVAEVAQRAWLGIAPIKEKQVQIYHRLSTQVGKDFKAQSDKRTLVPEDLQFKMDGSSLSLAAFFIFLFIVHAIFFYGWPLVNDPSTCSEVTSVRSGDEALPGGAGSTVSPGTSSPAR